MNGVFILRFLHLQHQRALAVVQRQAVDFLRTVGNAGHLANRDGDIVFARHDQLAKVLGPLHAGVDFDHAFGCQRANAANR